MKQITASSCAKVHLIGEYSAVFGKPTIVFPIDLKLSVTVQKSTKQAKKLPFQKAIELKITEVTKKKIPNYTYAIDSNIPIGSCIGSSAALSSAFTKAVLSLINYKANDDELFRIAVEGEIVFHGFPSGSDLKAILLRKPIWYRKETPELFFFKALTLNLPKDFQLFLVDSGRPAENTKQMVEYAKTKVNPRIFKQFADDQEELTKKMYTCLNNFDSDEFTEIINKAEENLEKINVVSKKAKDIIKKVHKIGGAAKINGAGGQKTGSGMVPAYHKNPEKLIKLAKQNNWNMIPVQILQ